MAFQRSRWLAAVLLLGLAACGTPNRDGAALIAKTGQEVAAALQLEATAGADAASRMADQYILTTVIKTCNHFTSDDSCASRDVAVTGNAQEGAAQIRSRLEERAKLFLAMREAYRALELEATYDGAADLSGAFKGLSSSLTLYAKVSNVVIGAPLEFAISEAGGWLGGLIGADRQARRLDEANRLLASALDQTITVVKADREYIQSFLRMAALDRKLFFRELVRAGIVPGYAAMYRNALPPGTATIADTQEAAIKGNRSLRLAAERLMEEHLSRPDDVLMRNYDLLIGSLTALREEHRAFQARRPPDLEQLTAALNAAAQAVNRWNGLNNPPVPPK